MRTSRCKTLKVCGWPPHSWYVFILSLQTSWSETWGVHGPRGDAFGETMFSLGSVSKMGVSSPAAAQSLGRPPVLAGGLQGYPV